MRDLSLWLGQSKKYKWKNVACPERHNFQIWGILYFKNKVKDLKTQTLKIFSGVTTYLMELRV